MVSPSAGLLLPPLLQSRGTPVRPHRPPVPNRHHIKVCPLHPQGWRRLCGRPPPKQGSCRLPHAKGFGNKTLTLEMYPAKTGLDG